MKPNQEEKKVIIPVGTDLQWKQLDKLVQLILEKHNIPYTYNKSKEA